jgi:hypothetical protein
MTEHRPLRERKSLLSSDVADAIETLVATYGQPGLPKALKLSNVVDCLIEIAHTDDDGAVQQIFPMLRQALTELYTNRLINSSVFQAGYKRYEKRSSNPVCPVTTFFFKVVFSNGDVADCLDAMSDLEIKHSLPKRVSVAMEEDGVTPILGSEGEVVNAGEIAGVVVFPPGTRATMLAAWLHRRANITKGLMQSTVDSIEHARPDTTSVERLKESARGVSGDLRRALPKPRR